MLRESKFDRYFPMLALAFIVFNGVVTLYGTFTLTPLLIALLVLHALAALLAIGLQVEVIYRNPDMYPWVSDE